MLSVYERKADMIYIHVLPVKDINVLRAIIESFFLSSLFYEARPLVLFPQMWVQKLPHIRNLLRQSYNYFQTDGKEDFFDKKIQKLLQGSSTKLL